MAVASIVSFDEVMSYMAKETESDREVIERVVLISRLAERSVRRYIGCNVVQATYAHILPAAGRCLGKPDLGEVLRLPEYPVRSIIQIREDLDACGGAASSAWPSESILTPGSDYYLAVDQAGISWFGHVVRRWSTWPAVAGSIYVRYTAGWSAAELDGDVDDPRLDASDIKLATLKTIADAYNRTQMGGGGGVVQSEKIDDYSVTYDTSQSAANQVQLPMDAKLLLGPFRRRVA